MNKSRWFGLAVWLGIAANLGFALPAIFTPDAFTAFFNLEPAVPSSWLRFAGWLLILLSLFYVIGARDPVGNRDAARLAVVARWAGAAFFLGQIVFGFLPAGYWPFGAADLMFGVVQTPLLLRLNQKRDAGDTRMS